MTVMLVVIGLVVIVEVLLLWVFGANFKDLWSIKDDDFENDEREQWRDKI